MATPTNPFQLYSYGVGGNVPSYTEQETLPPKYSQPLGQSLEYIGDFFGLPEGGLSESVAGGPTKNTDLRWYDAFKAKQALANEPTKTSVDYSFGDPNNPDLSNPVKLKDFEDYKSKQGSGDSGSGDQKTPVQKFKDTYTQSDIMEGQDPEQFYRDIENIYNEAMGLANKKEQTVRGLAESNKSDIERQYGVGEQTLGTSKSQALGTIAESGISARQRQEQALDAARRLYDEMNRGYQQRFGGASSAGEAAKSLANIEQQRQMGTTRQGYQDTMRQLETQKLQVEDNYKNELLGLQAKRDSAISQANNMLNSSLLEIDSDRASAGQEKALMKMNALKEYKDKLFNIANQEKAFRQNIDLMREQANIQLDSAVKQLASYGSEGQNSYNQFAGSTTLNPYSGLRVGVANTMANQLTGQVGDDELSKLLTMSGQIGAVPDYLKKSYSDVPSYFQQ